MNKPTSDVIRRLYVRLGELREIKASIEEELGMLEEMAAAPSVRAALDEYEGQLIDPPSVPISHSLSARLRTLGPHSEKMAVWRVAREIVEKNGAPMRLDDLADAIIKSGKEFGGTSASGSLSAHISQHPEALYQQDGWVYLKEWEGK